MRGSCSKMKMNKGWKLYYVQDSKFNNNIKDIYSYEYFDDVVIHTLFELELYRNHVLGHPYESTNNWDYQKYEDYHQFYVLKFKSNKKTKFLKLHGVDVISRIYLNGKLVGKTDNMFIPYTFKLTNLKKENELIIHVLPCVVEGNKFDNHKWYAPPYNYESLYLRKTPSSFGWDILPRTPLGGIYKDVELLDKLPLIEDVQIKASNISKRSAILRFVIKNRINSGCTYKISGKCKDSFFEINGGNKQKVVIKNPKLWTIRGFGEQNLYEIKVEAIFNDKVVESKIIKYGIRKVELKRSSTVCENGCFEFYINDEKVFLLGSNWVPIEAIKHIDDQRTKKAFDMLIDLNCNCLRVWGGGTYESDYFYDKCDELGIFVWQDFMMGCALYPQDEYFQNKLKEEVTYIVRHLRNHCSICLWAGDNENDLAFKFWSHTGMNAKDNVLTRKTIPEVILKEDNTRPYLPSSPYYDEYAEEHLDEPLSEDHLWGPRDYFKGEYYSNASCYFTSESGYHGLNNLSSLKKFIKKPWPLFEKEIYEQENCQYVPRKLLTYDSVPTKEYMCHGTSIKDDMQSPYLYRTALMKNQVITLFNNDIDNINDFITASQISQAEAFKYFIERMRKDYKRNGGIIWWNLIDGWPQVSDAIVDYYFSKKLAYFFIKNSQVDNLLMMNEDKDGLNLYCVSSNDKKHTLSYEIINAYTDEVIEKGKVKTKSRDSFVIKPLNLEKKTLFVIKYKDESGREYINHFHTTILDIDLYKYKNAMKKYGLMK